MPVVGGLMDFAGRTYPLFSTQRHIITGPDFVVLVEAFCRVLMVNEGDKEWWVYGVEPGGLSGEGDTSTQAYLRFTEGFKSAVTELAEEVDGFDAFESAVKSFVGERNEPTMVDWLEAVEYFARTAIPATFSNLPKREPNSKCYVSLTRLDFQALSTSVNANIDAPALAHADAA